MSYSWGEIVTGMINMRVGTSDKPLYLYKTVNEEHEPNYYKESTAYQKYIDIKDKIYGSPNNIRAVWIADTCVYVQTFEKISEKMGKSYAQKRDWFAYDKWECTHGNPLNGLSQKYYLKNLEELYIETDIIYTMMETMPWLTEKIGCDVNKLDDMLRSNLNKAVESEIPRIIWDAVVHQEFPRLHTFGITRYVASTDSYARAEFLIERSGLTENIESSIYNRENYMKMYGGSVMYSKFNVSKEAYMNMHTDPDIYLFDREYLSNFAGKYANNSTGIYKSNTNINTDSNITKTNNKDSNSRQAKNNVNSEVEAMEEMIRALDYKYGEKIANEIIKEAVIITK